MSSHHMAAGWPGRLAWALAMMDKEAPRGRRRGHRGRLEDFERLAAMRGMGGPPPFGGPPFGGGPRGAGRKRRGDVRIAMLILLAEEPRNGYQLMQTIEERSGGRWRPSPGSVYPALAQLEDEGFVRAVQQDGGRVFEITDAGREHVESRETAAPPWETGDEAGASTFHELRSLMIGIGKAAWQVAQEGDRQHWEQAAQILSEARRALYRILADELEDDAPDGTDA